jgi:transcriptional regulator with XRE-family HTH domain
LISADDFMDGLLEAPEARAIFDERALEFQLQTTMLRARQRASMTQRDIAEAIGTTDSAVCRMEHARSGRFPSMRLLQKYATATRHRLVVSFEPLDAETGNKAGTKVRKTKTFLPNSGE